MKIFSHGREFRCSVESKEGQGEIQLDDNDILMLHTCVRYGKIPREKGDFHYIYPDWKVPQEVVDSIQREHWATPCGQLFVISDNKGALRCIVRVGLIDRAYKTTLQMLQPKFEALKSSGLIMLGKQICRHIL